MKTTTIIVLCSLFAWGVCAQPLGLTAREYQPSPIEGLVNATLAGMQESEQPFDVQLEYIRSVLREHPKETTLHRHYQDMMRRDSIAVLRAEYRKLAEDNPDDPIIAYCNSRIAPTSQDRWRWAAHAVRSDPDFYWGHLALGYHFLNLSQPDLVQAEEELLRAVEIDNSISAAFVNLAVVYRHRADTTKMLEMYQLAGVCEPDNFSFVVQQVNLLRPSQPDMAMSELRNFIASHPDHEGALSSLKYLLYLDNRYEEVLEITRKLMQIGTPDLDKWYELACAFTLTGKVDSAFAALDKSIEMGWDDLKHLSDDPDLMSLHDDPRWDGVRAKIQSELDRTAPERRQEALKDRLDIPAPDFEYPDLDSNMVKLSDLRGKVVVIDFWALWCHWCLVAMPLLEDFWQDYQDRDVVVLSMNMMERRRQDVPGYIAEHGYTFRVVYGEDQLRSDYGIRGIPHMVVIDKEGIIRYKNIGYSPKLEETLGWQVEELLNR